MIKNLLVILLGKNNNNNHLNNFISNDINIIYLLVIINV